MVTEDPLRRYQIMEPLGSGRQGHTFRAVDRDTHRQVAIKVISLRSLTDGWKTYDLFEREVAVLKSLEHPGIPRFIDSYASEKTGDFFLVMELIDGTPLSDYVAGKRRLPNSQLEGLLRQVLDILEYLHGLAPAVIHRDIKPANLVVDGRGLVHLVDFGGVRRAISPEGGSTVIGTFGYMAPEQLYGQATSATDIYALGATFAALIAGVEAEQLPHEGLRIDVAAISAPPGLAEVLPKMLEPEPSQRLETVADVRRALDQAARTRGAQPPREARRRGPTSAAAAPEAEVSEQTALAIPDAAKELARLEGPLSVLVWIITALGSGILLFAEVALLPILFQLIKAISQSRHHRSAEIDYKKTLGAVRHSRRTLTYIADETRPDRSRSKTSPRASSKNPSR